MMISDSFFEMGFTHEVCEDYAVHGEKYAIVSDGCSNGGGPRINTDWGSRFLCKATERFVQDPDFSHNIAPLIIGSTVKQWQEAMGLDPKCLTATLLVLRALEDKFQAMAIGDGIVGGKRRDGRWKIHLIEFPEGPFYLKYKIFKEEKGFFDSFGDKYTVGTFFGKLVSDDTLPPNNPNNAERREFWAQQMSYSEKEFTFDPNVPYSLFEFPIDDYEFAFVCSDGMSSFYYQDAPKHNEDIFVLDAMRVVMDFVTIQQGFAKLQHNWAFRQDKIGTLRRRGWKHGDDVSVGIIHV